MNKKTLISLGIIAILAFAVVLQRTVHFSSVPDVETWKGNADEIVIKKGASPVVRIWKKDGVWVIGDAAYPADAATADILEARMNELSFSDLVTEKGYYDRFDLSEDRAVHVTVKGEGKILRELLIGKKSSAGEQSYVRFPGAKEVYLAGGNLSFEFGRDADSFRDRNLMSVTVDAIRSVTVNYKGSVFTLKKKASDKAEKGADPTVNAPWIAEGFAAELDQNRVVDFLREFASVSAESFPAEGTAAGAVQSVITVTTDGKVVTLTVYGKSGKGTTGGYYCRSSSNPSLAIVSAWKGEKLLKGLSDMKK